MKVIGTGLACLDIINQEKNNIVVMNGGTCANVLTALAQLGEESMLLLPQYDKDILGERFYSMFKSLNVNLSFYGNIKQNIPRIIEVYDEFLKHSFYTKCPHCNRDLIKQRFISNREAKKVIETLKNYDVFFTDRISDGIKSIAKECNQNNTMVFFEPNSGRNAKALIEMARSSNVVKFSTDRISMNLANSVLGECQESALKLVIATHGKEGLSFCYKMDSGLFTGWIHVPTVEFKKMRDTSGAGDWLTAGFLHYWRQEEFTLCKKSIYNALGKSLRLSAVVSMTAGAQGVFYDEEVLEILRKEHAIELEAALDCCINYNDNRYCDVCLSEI